MLDLNSDLINNQRRIEHISLITCGSRGSHLPIPDVLLGEFKTIRSLSWKGLSRTDDFDSVRDCIKINAQGIQSLELDLRNWLKARAAYYDGMKKRGQLDFGFAAYDFADKFFATDVLGMFPGEARVILPHLSSLSLSQVSFQAAVKEMQHALNVTRLVSLKLRNCRYSLALLDAIVRGAQTMRLKSFELVIDIEADEGQGAHEQEHDVSIFAFLNSFRGLEDLYLLVTDPMKWELIFRNISSHLSTLDRLITHRRKHDPTSATFDSPILLCNESKNLYQGAHSTCIGTCSTPSDLVRDWGDLSPKPICKILHLRIDFADEPYADKFNDDMSKNYDFFNEEAGSDEETTLNEESSVDGVRSNLTDNSLASVQSLPNTSASRPDFAPWSLPPPETSYGAKRIRKVAAENIDSKYHSKVVDCARWAFSDNGLPNLQILAFGDFSHEGRY